MARYEARTFKHDRYPVAIIDTETGQVESRWYTESTSGIAMRLERLNGQKTSFALTPADDSDLSLGEAIDRCRALGDSSPGNGWRRLLWRLADLLESKEL